MDKDTLYEVATRNIHMQSKTKFVWDNVQGTMLFTKCAYHYFLDIIILHVCNANFEKQILNFD